MGDLAAFILARIEEDEAAARAVVDSHEMWDWESYVESAGMYTEPAHDFAKRHDPARVLAQCAALREVINVARYAPEGPDGWGYRRTLRALASIWAEHSDYDPAWRLADG